MDTNELQLKCKDAELFLGKCVLGKEVHTMKKVPFLKGEAESLTCNLYGRNIPKIHVWLMQISHSQPTAFPPLYHKTELSLTIIYLHSTVFNVLLKPSLNHTCTCLD